MTSAQSLRLRWFTVGFQCAITLVSLAYRHWWTAVASGLFLLLCIQPERAA